MALNYPKDCQDDKFDERYIHSIIDTRLMIDHISENQPTSL